jgi:hypothetical protein
MIALPIWLWLIIMAVGVACWIYEVSVIRPRKRKERADRKQALYGSTDPKRWI